MRLPNIALSCATVFMLLVHNYALADEHYWQPEQGQQTEKGSASSSASSSASASAPPVEEFKSIADAKAAKAAKLKKIEEERIKESQASDDVAAKIAEKLALIRKEKANRLSNSAQAYRRPASGVAKPDIHSSVKKHAEWSYEGENGPAQWGNMDPKFAQCNIGERQSPIDIRDGFRVDLDPLQFDYRQTKFNVVNNGHTIQVGVNPGQYVHISGKSFELVQFHFHRPAEERINGKSFAMVVHLVHKDVDGKLAVVAILIEQNKVDSGKAHDVVQAVWNNLPLEKMTTVKALHEIDLSQMLPKTLDYYTYMGSLTTPPCSEGVLWVVMKEPIEISSEQLSIFSRLYPMNARPLQKTSDRMIKESR
jgi:carbonic anhydrase